jgi:hypothetical protein
MQAKEKELDHERGQNKSLKKETTRLMNDVSRLEAQLDAADVKPKSKLSQRPNDQKHN